MPGSYIELHDDVITTFALPIRYVDASRVGPAVPAGADRDDVDGGRDTTQPDVTWISAPWLRASATDSRSTAERLVDLLPAAPAAPPSGLTADDVDGLTAWLLATRPDGLTIAGLPDYGRPIGASTRTGLALVGPAGEIRAGTDDAGDILNGWISRWRAAGSPGWERASGVAVEHPDGWAIRMTLR